MQAFVLSERLPKVLVGRFWAQASGLRRWVLFLPVWSSHSVRLPLDLAVGNVRVWYIGGCPIVGWSLVAVPLGLHR